LPPVPDTLPVIVGETLGVVAVVEIPRIGLAVVTIVPLGWVTGIIVPGIVVPVGEFGFATVVAVVAPLTAGETAVLLGDTAVPFAVGTAGIEVLPFGLVVVVSPVVEVVPFGCVVGTEVPGVVVVVGELGFFGVTVPPVAAGLLAVPVATAPPPPLAGAPNAVPQTANVEITRSEIVVLIEFITNLSFWIQLSTVVVQGQNNIQLGLCHWIE
jgi:hypothetical protein